MYPVIPCRSSMQCMNRKKDCIADLYHQSKKLEWTNKQSDHVSEVFWQDNETIRKFTIANE